MSDAEEVCLKSTVRTGTAYHEPSEQGKRRKPPMMTILLVILILMLLGAVPRWEHSREWGYGPSGLLFVLVVVLVILLLTGRL